MIKADKTIFEEMSQILNRSANRIDEIQNLLRNLIAEMSEDTEFMLFEQSDNVCDKTQAALDKLNRAHYISSSLGNIISSLPKRYMEIEQTTRNDIANMMVSLEQIKAQSLNVSSDNMVFPNLVYEESQNDSNHLSHDIAYADLSLSTAIIQNQLKVTRIEDSDE